MLTEADAPGLPRRSAGDPASHDPDQHPHQPRRHVIHDVIQPRAAPAESQIARPLEPDHRVHRADHLEQNDAREAADEVPSEWAGKSVHKILAEALDGGATAGGTVPPIGVAT